MGASITGAFGVPGENYNGRRVVDFCAESGLWVGNTYFEPKSLHSIQGWQRAKMEWRECSLCVCIVEKKFVFK